MTRRKIGTIGYADADMALENCVRIADRMLPRRIVVTLPGAGGQPRLKARLELVDGIPQCREITIASVDGGREVKQLDLRGIGIADMVEGVYGAFARRIVSDENGVLTVAEEAGDGALIAAMNAVADARKGKGARKINAELLTEVAEVYKQHIDANPTQAVERWFGVKRSMAAEYVRRARQEDLLPPTTPGKKLA
ncbi:MAG TPA: hypothetical protein VIR33_14295 [Thermopolyspora sp.]|jgi:hypothetical protein